MREPSPSTLLRRGVIASLLFLLGLILGCESSKHHPARKGAGITVFAVASLRNPFTEMGRQFERDNPGVVLVFNFAGSQHGANAEVFAAAERRHVDASVRTGVADSLAVFARNELALVVAKEVANLVASFPELPNADCIVVGVLETPIGAYTRLLDRANGLYGRGRITQVGEWQELVARPATDFVRQLISREEERSRALDISTTPRRYLSAV